MDLFEIGSLVTWTMQAGTVGVGAIVYLDNEMPLKNRTPNLFERPKLTSWGTLAGPRSGDSISSLLTAGKLIRDPN